MQSNLRLTDRIIRLIFGAILLFIATVILKSVVERVIFGFAGLFSLWEALSGSCLLMAKLGVKTKSDSFSPEIIYLFGVLFAQFIIAYEWFNAGLEKIMGGSFVQGFSHTLTAFAAKNPQIWYKDFLENLIMPIATPFAYVIECGELLTGLALGLTAITYIFSAKEGVRRVCALFSILALIGGALMNANFYFAAGWMSPSTAGINILMFWIQGTLLYVWLMRLSSSKKS